MTGRIKKLFVEKQYAYGYIQTDERENIFFHGSEFLPMSAKMPIIEIAVGQYVEFDTVNKEYNGYDNKEMLCAANIKILDDPIKNFQSELDKINAMERSRNI